MKVKPISGNTVSFSQLCENVADDQAIVTAAAKEIINSTFTHIQRALVGGNSVATPLGKFKRADRKARTGRNPHSGETIKIAAKNGVKFTPNKALKDAML